jgi:hypothetical protein
MGCNFFILYGYELVLLGFGFWPRVLLVLGLVNRVLEPSSVLNFDKNHSKTRTITSRQPKTEVRTRNCLSSG